MKRSKLSILYFILPALVASFFGYMACRVYASPLLHGILSADVFFLMVLLMLPRRHFLYKLPFAVLVCFLAVIANSVDAYATMALYLLMILVTAVVPRRRLFLILAYEFFAILFVVADAENFFFYSVLLTLPDAWDLAKFFWWGPLLFFVVPPFIVMLELLFARKILWGERRVEISHRAGFVVVVAAVILNFGINWLQPQRLILDCTVQKWFHQLCSPEIARHSTLLQDDIKALYPVWEKDRPVVDDYSKPTVMILVESYGVKKSVDRAKALFSPFEYSHARFLGLYPRNASHTQGAEWEDFGTPRGKVREQPVPMKFRENHLQTWYVHGYDREFYSRGANYAKFGFDRMLFKEDFEKMGLPSCSNGFEGICDSAMVYFLDSLLTDPVPKFVYWTTLDAHPLYEWSGLFEKSYFCKIFSLSDVDCTYFTLQENSLRMIADLVARHPEYRFVIRGDHRPMVSLEQSDFVQSFYFRWVPLIIVN